jgi:copper homeostasis protein
VICCSVDDAAAAQRGGATRLEVTVQLDLAGLTPPAALLEEMLSKVPLRVRAMLRERASFTISGREELERLKRLAHHFESLGVDGIVVGFVKDSMLDVEALREILAEVPATHFTIHHALEMTGDPLAALREVRQLRNVDRCLVHGGTGSIDERVPRLIEYRTVLGPERTLILGGGVTLVTLAEFARRTGLTEYHLGRAVRTPETAEGQVDAEKVERAVRILNTAAE